MSGPATTTTTTTTATGPFAGLRVIDFCAVYAGPFACSLLGQLGAEVIRVETKARPDQLRTRGARPGAPEGPGFHVMNRNKRSITLDLNDPRAKELAKRLVATSDVVMENFRPGVMEKLGLGYEELRALKPDLVMTSLSAMGDSGPERKYGALAVTFSALAGLSHLTGYPDSIPTEYRGSSDFRSGFGAFFATVAALYHRQKTGEGQHVDFSARETLTSLIPDALMDYQMNGRVRGPQGNEDESMAPHGCFPSAGDDHWVAIAVENEEQWRCFCSAIGRPELADDPRFSSEASRRAHRAELDEVVAAWTRGRTDYEAMHALQAAGVPAGVTIRTDQIAVDPHVHARQMLHPVEHPVIGQITLMDVPWRLTHSPALPPRPASMRGEDNEYVFGGILKLPAEEIDELVSERVIY